MSNRATSDIGPFSIVPEWVTLALISDRAVRLFALLARYADRQGEATPGRRTLAQALGASVDSLDRALRELIGIGAVEIEPRRDTAGDQTSNLYRLRFAAREVSEVAAPLRPPIRTPAAPGGRAPAATVAAPVRPRTKAIGTKEVQERRTAAAPQRVPESDPDPSDHYAVITAVVTKDILPRRLPDHELTAATMARCTELRIACDDEVIRKAVDSALFRYYRAVRHEFDLPPDPREIYHDHPDIVKREAVAS